VIWIVFPSGRVVLVCNHQEHKGKREVKRLASVKGLLSGRQKTSVGKIFHNWLGLISRCKAVDQALRHGIKNRIPQTKHQHDLLRIFESFVLSQGLRSCD